MPGLGEVLGAGSGDDLDVAGASEPAVPAVADVPPAFTGLDALTPAVVASVLAALGLILVTLGRRASRA